MKFFKSALSLLAVSQVALAAPTPLADEGAIEVRSLNPAGDALATLERRAGVCQKIDTVIRTIGTSKVTVIYITSGVGLARAICAYVNGDNCGDLALIISSGLSLVYAAAAHYSGATPEGLPSKRDADIHSDYRTFWEGAIGDSDLAFEDLINLPFNTTEATLTRRDGDPALLSRLHIAGIKPISNTTAKHDIIANLYDNGETVLHLPVAGDVDTTGSDSTLAKRYDKAGFKISYTTRTKSQLTRSHQNSMAASVAANWAYYADHTKMNEYIGFAETGHSANFYYRIIPETKGFGLNYESVDVCGGMASFL